MGDAALSLDDVFERTGLAAKWEARAEARGEAKGEARGEIRGEERKAIDIAKNMIKMGLPKETIVTATGLKQKKVKELFKEVNN